MEPQRRRRIRVSEVIPVPRQTVPGLMEAFQAAFSGNDKPVRILYCRGEDLQVERSVLSIPPDKQDAFITPYQMIRQHSELEIQEIIDSPLLACCAAVQELRSQGFDMAGIVVAQEAALKSWLPDGVDLAQLFGVELHVDPDTPEGCLFFFGSQVSGMIRDIEKSICCRMV